MHIFLTGGTGFIGKPLLKDLVAHKHTVTALARTDVAAIALAAIGATPLLGDLTDLDTLRTGASQADARLGRVAVGRPRRSSTDPALYDPPFIKPCLRRAPGRPKALGAPVTMSDGDDSARDEAPDLQILGDHEKSL